MNRFDGDEVERLEIIWSGTLDRLGACPRLTELPPCKAGPDQESAGPKPQTQTTIRYAQAGMAQLVTTPTGGSKSLEHLGTHTARGAL